MSQSTPLPRAIVSAIIEKEENGRRLIFLQTRWKPSVDPANSGCLEIPAGGIDSYEEVHDAIKREVREETGLIITDFIDDFSTPAVFSTPNNASIAFRPFICQQSTENIGGLPWVGFVFRCHASGEPKLDPSEAKDPQWVTISQLQHILNETPEKVFSLQIAALKYYAEVFKDC